MLQTDGQEIKPDLEIQFGVKDKYLAAGCPPGSRGYDPLFQPAPHMHAIELVSGKPLKVCWGLWNVLQLGRFDLHNFFLLIDFTLSNKNSKYTKKHNFF